MMWRIKQLGGALLFVGMCIAAIPYKWVTGKDLIDFSK
jgi:hypothetical protein